MVQAGAAVAGLSTLGCDGPATVPGSQDGAGSAPRKPKFLLDALERMRKENKPGIALRLSSDLQSRHPGQDLEALLNREKSEYREMFAEIVFVCLQSPVLQAHLKGADPGHSLVLFDVEGRAEAGMAFTYSEDCDRFARAALDLAHGPNLERLKRRADEILRKADPATIEALSRLGNAEGDRAPDSVVLFQEVPRIAPLLVFRRLEATSAPLKEWLGGILDFYVGYSSPAPLPYGVELAAQKQVDRDPCPTCGMAFIQPASRTFVKYLTR
jgi:hypothetical protein